jgi:ribosomal protein S27E
MDTTDRHLDAAEAAATRSLACPVCGLVVCLGLGGKRE